ncbi:MAG: DUF59 domain-containing protein [Bacteroidales bacterium]|nr:DUF59 domain-containing protein [Bacteroidales bacterium]
MKDNESLKADIIERLKKIYDPEIPINIWDMGLIYDIQIDNERHADIVMTVTAPNCPVAETLPPYVKSELESNIPELKDVDVRITFDPPWDLNKMSEEAKTSMGFDFL